jgi:putative SOS response-associated peptidase YedK
MCGRFSLFHNAEEIRRRFKLKKLYAEWMKRYNIAPNQQILIVRKMDGENIAEAVQWGFIPHWTKDGVKELINARAESIKEKPTFRDSFRSKRCLVIADGFYEWQKVGKTKQPYRITLKDSGLFAFAGLYDDWREKRTAAIVTTTSNTTMRPIHDRMPAILGESDEDIWLGEETDSAVLDRMLRPYADDGLTAIPIGKEINDPKNDRDSAISAQRERQRTLD